METVVLSLLSSISRAVTSRQSTSYAGCLDYCLQQLIQGPFIQLLIRFFFGLGGISVSPASLLAI